jgi:hypothetical protein
MKSCLVRLRLCVFVRVVYWSNGLVVRTVTRGAGYVWSSFNLTSGLGYTYGMPRNLLEIMWRLMTMVYQVTLNSACLCLRVTTTCICFRCGLVVARGEG